MGFPLKVKTEALTLSKRYCCLCHQFAGLYVNVHHIIPESKGGPNTLDNAIVVCLRCHGEVGHFNTEHPIGNKYTPQELIRRRDEWYKVCQEVIVHRDPPEEDDIGGLTRTGVMLSRAISRTFFEPY